MMPAVVGVKLSAAMRRRCAGRALAGVDFRPEDGFLWPPTPESA
jgi:hypothetical protein